MNSHKQTKRALLTSIMALVMCVVMLVGTTFAWFTDTARTSVNRIEAGKLDVALEMKNPNYIAGGTEKEWISAEGETLNFLQMKDDGTAVQNADILWEPGATYQLPELQIKNAGKLALKYKIAVSGAKDADNDPDLNSLKLLDVLEWTYTVDNENYALESNKSLGVGETDTLVIKATMDKNANNDYQNMAIDGIAITVYATQDTVEYDSTTDQYDKDAAYAAYPADVTTESFEQQTSVEYTNNLGEVITGNKPAVAAYVDASGNVKYVGDIWAAIKSNASVIYCKKDATIRMRERLDDTNRTPELTRDLTIYANGADFQYGEIAMSFLENDSKNANITLKVYDAKNIYVFGWSPNDGITQNVILENCHNEGTSATNTTGRLFYLAGTTGTVHATLRNCSVAKSESPVYMKSNGSVTLENCSFSQCAAAVKISHAAAGTCNVTITNTTFDKCGCTKDVYPDATDGYVKDSSSIKCKTIGTMNLTLENVAITDVVGSNSIVTETGVSVNATNVTVDGTAWNN